MGFSLKWIHLISECISIVSYSDLVNGEPTKFFKPTRGLVKGTLYPLTYFSYAVKVLPNSLIMLFLLENLEGIPYVGMGLKYLNYFL